MCTNLVSSIDVITVSEHRSKVALALSTNIMMIIVVVRATIKRNIFCQSPRELIPVCRQHQVRPY